MRLCPVALVMMSVFAEMRFLFLRLAAVKQVFQSEVPLALFQSSVRKRGETNSFNFNLSLQLHLSAYTCDIYNVG